MEYIGMAESQVSEIAITPHSPDGFKDSEKEAPKNRAEEIEGSIQVCVKISYMNNKLLPNE